MKRIFLLWLAAGLVWAAEPAGFVLWRAADLKAFGDKLAPKIDAHKVAAERLGKFGNHSFMVGHREGTGEAEWHEWDADVFVVEAGQAELIVGGEMPEAKVTSAGEKRGPKISGGETVKLAAGDIVHIPAQVPHQLIMPAGQRFTYFVMKVDVRK
jgi:mannose-6-phosphate isomerase-like protein (cupin superfamily)